MATAHGCRVDDFASGSGLGFGYPDRQLVAWDHASVPEVLAEAEASTRFGNHAVGFVTYEAAPAFDPALTVRGREEGDPLAGLPLAWFGVFGQPRPGAVPDRCRRSIDTPWSWALTEAGHAASVRVIQDQIASGWTYQANLTTRLHTNSAPAPEDLYRYVGRNQAGAFSAYLTTADWAVACASPELFFSLDDGVVTTRPMKGTARRGITSAEDNLAARRLASSPKERAENVMIVDLLRNDLGRIAQPGSVEVTSLFDLEAFPTVWQLTSTVTARLRPERRSVVDVFAALFPCGSVTGAPKVATMSLLAQLETRPRGVYCGAVGFLAPGGRARFAVAIRTATVNRRTGYAEFGVGGGITADSDPSQEWAELAAKASILAPGPAPAVDGDVDVEALGHHAPSPWALG